MPLLFPVNAVQVSTNGVFIERFESSAKSTFTAFALHADAVHNLTLRSNSNQFEHEGFSLLEVRGRSRHTPPMKISVDLYASLGVKLTVSFEPLARRSIVWKSPPINNSIF